MRAGGGIVVTCLCSNGVPKVLGGFMGKSLLSKSLSSSPIIFSFSNISHRMSFFLERLGCIYS